MSATKTPKPLAKPKAVPTRKPKPTAKPKLAPDVVGTYAEGGFGLPFQFHLLAVCVCIPDFVLRFRTALSHLYFTGDTERLIARGLFAHMDAHHMLPHRTTLLETCRTLANPDELPAVETALDRLYAEDITDHPAVAALAVNFGKTQAMANAVLEAAEELDKGNREKIIPIVQEAALVGEDLLSVGLRYADWPVRREWYLTPPEVHQARLIPTGIPHLDHALGGGLARGNLGVVVAPPKRGKSTLLINFGFGALTRPLVDHPTGQRGFNVLHLSLEMHQDDILRRYDDRLAGSAHIKDKHVAPQQYVEYLESQQALVLGDLYVKSYPTRSLTPTGIRALLTLLAARGFKPDLLIADYADIMKAERRLGEMRHEQASIYEDLRTIAGEFDLACWTGSQATRGALEKETLTIADFAESFEKAAIVDCALAFCQTENERVSIPTQCRLFLAAYRNHEDGRMVQCMIRRDCCHVISAKLHDPVVGGLPLAFDVEIKAETAPTATRQTRILPAPSGKPVKQATPVAGPTPPIAPGDEPRKSVV